MSENNELVGDLNAVFIGAVGELLPAGVARWDGRPVPERSQPQTALAVLLGTYLDGLIRDALRMPTTHKGFPERVELQAGDAVFLVGRFLCPPGVDRRGTVVKVLYDGWRVRVAYGDGQEITVPALSTYVAKNEFEREGEEHGVQGG